MVLVAVLSSGAYASAEARRPVLVADVDADLDDISALAYLCQEHKLGRIELAAVTVTNAGAGSLGSAIQHVRCTLEACGLPDIPVAEGSREVTNLASPFMREGIKTLLSRVFEGCTQSDEPSAVSAPQLLADILREHESVRVVTLGPVGNVAEALELAPELESHVESVYLMGGAVHVPGNICCGLESQYDNTQEFNIMADAASAQALIATLNPRKVFLVPLDATQDVPVTQAFASRLDSLRVGSEPATPELGLVSSILSQPEVRYGIGFGLLYWWDPLTVVAATRPGVVPFEPRPLEVVQEGPSLGRTMPSSQGTRVRVGLRAHQARFEELFLDTLQGR
ncbi:nucleoside hydrolase [Archangium sp.]|uniref:nucleoside hydrolase n=1 Tax=Archangium sp. TaxID=1872627 RepID=UPI003899BB06